MIRKVLTFVFLIAIVVANAQTRYSRVKINLRNKTLQNLVNSGVEIDHGILKAGKYFIGEFSQEELGLIKAAGYDYKIEIEDLEKELLMTNEQLESRGDDGCNQKSKKDYKIPDNFHLGSMAGNLTYSEMLKSLDSMRLLYPELISVKQTIDTFLTEEGRPVYWYKISDNVNKDEDEPEVLYTALHHAREPVSMMQMVFYMWYLLENYGKDDMVTYLVDNREMYFIPCVNPDGYIYNQSTNPYGGGFWRKNRRDNGDDSFGVDLNRNYGYKWGFDDNGSSPDKNSGTYRGESAFSEEETKAVKYFCENHNFIIALNFHTYSNLLIHPWGFSPVETKDSTAFIALGNLLTSENGYNSGLAIQTVGYNANGDSDDWMYGDTLNKNSIFTFTPEVGIEGFWPSESSIIPQCKENIFLNLTAAAVIDPYITVDENTPDVTSVRENSLVLELKNTGLKEDFVTINVKSIGSQILDYSEKFYMKSFTRELKTLPYTLGDNVVDDSPFSFEVVVDNGLFVTIDTIEKIFATIREQLVSDCNDLDMWNTSGTGWSTTNKEFVSPDYSITDSPDGNYLPNTKNELVIKNKFYVPDDENVFLVFQAKWDIEKVYDWAAVFASKDGVGYKALCSNETVTGTKDQLVDEPVFDGTQESWTPVIINLDEYAGDSIYIKFVMNSDPYVNGDGFYFDDLKIVSYGKSKTNITKQVPFSNIALSPNPANGYVRLTNLVSGDRLIIENIFGQNVFDKKINDNSISIRTYNWSDGLYLYYVVRDGKKSIAGKFTVVH